MPWLKLMIVASVVILLPPCFAVTEPSSLPLLCELSLQPELGQKLSLTLPHDQFVAFIKRLAGPSESSDSSSHKVILKLISDRFVLAARDLAITHKQAREIVRVLPQGSTERAQAEIVWHDANRPINY
jgi:hypothetical protein